MELVETIKSDLKNELSEKRYTHSLGVMQMAAELAKIHNEDVEQASIAGLLHDIAKEMSVEESMKYLEENNIEIDEIEKASTYLLHGKIGADIAKKRYGVSPRIQKAIEYHTETNPEMDTLAKIVYVADKTELNRKSDGYEIFFERELAKKDLDATVLYIINSTIRSLIEKGKLIHPTVLKTRNALIMKKMA